MPTISPTTEGTNAKSRKIISNEWKTAYGNTPPIAPNSNGMNHFARVCLLPIMIEQIRAVRGRKK
jgi:hypothetical protein